VSLGRKIRRVVGALFAALAAYRFIAYALYWLRNPGLTEMQVFLANWRWLVGAAILLLVGIAILTAWRPFLPYPPFQGDRPQVTRHHYTVRKHGKTIGGER